MVFGKVETYLDAKYGILFVVGLDQAQESVHYRACVWFDGFWRASGKAMYYVEGRSSQFLDSPLLTMLAATCYDPAYSVPVLMTLSSEKEVRRVASVVWARILRRKVHIVHQVPRVRTRRAGLWLASP